MIVRWGPGSLPAALGELGVELAEVAAAVVVRAAAAVTPRPVDERVVVGMPEGGW